MAEKKTAPAESKKAAAAETTQKTPTAKKPATKAAPKKTAAKAPAKKTAPKKTAVKAAPKLTKTAPEKETVTEAAAVEIAATEEAPATEAVATSKAESAAPTAPEKTTRPGKKSPSKSGKAKAEKTLGRGRKYFEAAKLVDRAKAYPVDEAVKLVKETSTTKFDATVEIHFRLGVDPRKAEQNIRGTVKLPAGTGKTLRVLAFVPEAQAAAAKKAGADFVADDDLKKKIADGWAEFDVAVATPDQMVEVAKLGKVLGPKGLMPNPKAGTVSAKPADAIAEVKKGTIEYRLAKDGTVHAGVGKVSFSEVDLIANLKTYYQAIQAAKPTELKGTYVRSVVIASSMGPGIKLSPESLRA